MFFPKETSMLLKVMIVVSICGRISTRGRFRVQPFNCQVTSSSQKEFQNSPVKIKSENFMGTNQEYVSSFGAFERGYLANVAQSKALIIAELTGMNTMVVYLNDDTSKFIKIRALESSDELQSVEHLEGILVYWTQYELKKKLGGDRTLDCFDLKETLENKMPSEPIRLMEYRDTPELLERTIDDKFGLLDRSKPFKIEMNCELRIISNNRRHRATTPMTPSSII